MVHALLSRQAQAGNNAGTEVDEVSVWPRRAGEGIEHRTHSIANKERRYWACLWTKVVCAALLLPPYLATMTLIFEDLAGLPPVEFSKRAADLLQKACPEKADEPFFNRNMVMAKALGLTWVEGLQYVIQRRRELN